jgi:hypothetical protein
LSPRHAHQLQRQFDCLFQELQPIELAQRQPDEFLLAGRLKFSLDALGDFSRSRFAVTLLPDQRGCLVQTMGPVTIEIVDQDFVR